MNECTSEFFTSLHEVSVFEHGHVNNALVLWTARLYEAVGGLRLSEATESLHYCVLFLSRVLTRHCQSRSRVQE